MITKEQQDRLLGLLQLRDNWQSQSDKTGEKAAFSDKVFNYARILIDRISRDDLEVYITYENELELDIPLVAPLVEDLSVPEKVTLVIGEEDIIVRYLARDTSLIREDTFSVDDVFSIPLDDIS